MDSDDTVPPGSDQSVPSAVDAMSIQPPQTAIPVIPPLAPISAPPRPIPAPLNPIPVRSSVSKPPVAPNHTDSDEHEPGSPREYEISEESKKVRERQEKALQEVLTKRRAAALAVPTNDNAVRARLRRLGEPITLFGEKEMERRDRLRMLMAKVESEEQLDKLVKVHEEEESAATGAAMEPEEEIQYPFFTEGEQTLLEARREIAKYSLVKSALRLHRARRKREDPDEDLDAEIDWSLNQAGSLVLESSEIGDDRPLSGCSISHDGTMLATW